MIISTFVLLFYSVWLIVLLAVAAGISEFVFLVIENKRFYSTAKVGDVLKPRKSYSELIAGIFRGLR